MSPTYITNAHVIYGPDLARVQGGDMRKKSTLVETKKMKIQKCFYLLHHFVTLTAGLIYVN